MANGQVAPEAQAPQGGQPQGQDVMKEAATSLAQMGEQIGQFAQALGQIGAPQEALAQIAQAAELIDSATQGLGVEGAGTSERSAANIQDPAVAGTNAQPTTLGG